MLEKMADFNGESFDPHEIIQTTVASTMLALIYGECSEQDAKNFIHCEEQLNTVFQQSVPYMLLDAVPLLRFVVPSVKKAFQEFITEFNNINRLYDNITAPRRKKYKHPHVEFLMDHYLKLSFMDNSQEDDSRMVNDTDIRSMGVDMFGAGMSTTSNTLKMMLAVLVNHPGIQDAAHTEIVNVIRKRKPRIEDRLSMPFVEALILETLRYHSLVMLAVPHQVKFCCFLFCFFQFTKEKFWDQ